MLERDSDRPDLQLIRGDGADPAERDPIDALVEVLAGVDGDEVRARDVARAVIETGQVPTDDPVDWLHYVLEDQLHRAETADSDLETHVWRGEAMGWVAESARTVARVEAELALMAMHGGPHTCIDGDTVRGCSVVRWLAYAHRFDAPGWREEWAPTEAAETGHSQ